ncbi:MAG TPA: hypothetical protein VMY78_08625 [Solirubrobacteraceae bacterium]|nr:hypothetical protein [Solirubrobacteraceae bacterium]
MPPLRRPAQSTVSGLGVAGAVLAAVVVTFAAASGFVAYSLTSEDPIAPQSAELVLDTGSLARMDSTPLVLRAAATDRTRRPAAAGTRAVAASTSVARAGRGTVDGSRTSGAGTGRGPGAGGQDDGGSATTNTPGATPARVLEPVSDALGATTGAVDATTSSLTRRLRAAAERLRTDTGRAVGDTGDILQNVADGPGQALSHLLGIPRR